MATTNTDNGLFFWIKWWGGGALTKKSGVILQGTRKIGLAAHSRAPFVGSIQAFAPFGKTACVSGGCYFDRRTLERTRTYRDGEAGGVLKSIRMPSCYSENGSRHTCPIMRTVDTWGIYGRISSNGDVDEIIVLKILSDMKSSGCTPRVATVPTRTPEFTRSAATRIMYGSIIKDHRT